MKTLADFENKLKRLENIVTTLEKNEQSLEQTVTLFKEGMGLSKECRKVLDDVGVFVRKVINDDGSGNIETADIIEDENLDDEIPF